MLRNFQWLTFFKNHPSSTTNNDLCSLSFCRNQAVEPFNQHVTYCRAVAPLGSSTAGPKL